MKCPFRKITNYSKNAKYRAHRPEGGFGYYTERVSCKSDEADQVVEDFADCLKLECPYYREGDVCTKVMEATV